MQKIYKLSSLLLSLLLVSCNGGSTSNPTTSVGPTTNPTTVNFDEEFTPELLSCVKVHLWRRIKYGTKIPIKETQIENSLRK